MPIRSMILSTARGLFRRLPIVLQAEITECGIACLCMLLGYYGRPQNLQTLRTRFPGSAKGTTLAELADVAGALGFESRALQVSPEELRLLRLPCILYWNQNHFVVLKEVRRDTITIHDPSVGIRKIVFDEVAQSLSGAALEVNPRFEGDGAHVSHRNLSLMEFVYDIVKQRSELLHLICISLFLEASRLASPLLMQWVIDLVVPHSNRDLMFYLAAGFSVLLLVEHGLRPIRSWLLTFFSSRLSLQWRGQLFSHLVHLPIEFFQKRHLGDIMSRFTSVDVIQRTLTTSFLETLLDGLMAGATLSLMCFYSLELTMIVIAATALYFLLRLAWYGKLRTATEIQIIEGAKQQSHFLETMRGIKTIKLFGHESERKTGWIRALSSQINADIEQQRLQLCYRALNGIIYGLQNVTVVYLGAISTMNAKFTIGALIAFTSYKGMFDSKVGALVDRFFELRMLRLQADRVSDIALTSKEETDATTLPQMANASFEPSIEVKDLSFRHSVSDKWLLQDVSFCIHPGESVALTGPSGSGKTTLIQILLGILHAQEGTVRYGGLSRAQLGLNRIRKSIGTVMQDDTLFAGSILDNITFFAERPDINWAEQCARAAQIHDEIQSMPMQYRTLVGDMGSVLSGGQKQRVLLARAFYKQPSILVLDEATSHLDLQTEVNVNNAISKMKLTRIIVAHRPQTIASADRELSLRNGQITEIVRTPAVVIDSRQCTNAVALTEVLK